MSQERSTNSSRRRVANGAVALFIVTCGIVAITVTHWHAISPSSSSSGIESPTATAAVASPSIRGTIPKINGGDQQQQQRRQQSSSFCSFLTRNQCIRDPACELSGVTKKDCVASIEALEAPPTTIKEAISIGGHSNCSVMNRKQCKKDPACELSGATRNECVDKPNQGVTGGGGGIDLGGGNQPILLSGSDPCAQKSKKLCRKDPECKYRKKGGYCSSRTKLNAKPNNDAPPDIGTVVVANPQGATDVCPGEQCRSPEGLCKVRLLCLVNPCVTVLCESGVCQANSCGGCRATCVADPLPPLQGDTARPEKYWPLPSSSQEQTGIECVKSSEYPDNYLNVRLSYPLLFDTYEECCAAYPCDGVAIEPTDPALPRPKDGNPAKCAIGSAASLDLQTACVANDEFCQLHTGGCNTKPLVHYGTCATKTSKCQDIYSPVCGCDDRTYGNSCSAQNAGVSVSRMGECTKPTFGEPLPEPMPEPATKCANGSAAPPARPVACTMMYDPVCGCDDNTYGNSCAARNAGVSVSHTGECYRVTLPREPEDDFTFGEFIPEPATKCAIGSRSAATAAITLDRQTDCSDGEFCQLSTGTCNTRSGEYFGLCTARHVACTMIYAPVCGCDGVTYASECSARGAGASLSRMGECSKPATLSREPEDDPVLKYEPGYEPGETMTSASPTWGDLPNIPSPTEPMGPGPIFRMFQGPCTTVGDCEGDLVCDTATRECICNTSTNEGCSPGQTCGVSPEAFCPPQGCLPTCTCDFTSDAIDGSNGCPVGEVCRSPCAIADAGPMCFKSNEKRDCEWWGDDYECNDTNGDGMIDRKDGASGCVEMKQKVQPGEANTTIEATNPTLPPPDPVPRLDGNLATKCAIGSAATLDLQTACIANDEFCQLDTGACHIKPAVHFGTCATKPVVCTKMLDPVCGCDDITYGNSCMAQNAGESVLHLGECENPVKPGEATNTDITEPMSEPMFKMYQGPCTDEARCEAGLVCHAATMACICNTSTNEGCDPGETCGVAPGVDCPPEGCLPTCTCDYNSDAIDGSNGCPVGEVCRSPCAVADAEPMCFKSNEKRDCGDWGSDFVCNDNNGDGVLDRKDGGSGCVEMKQNSVESTDSTVVPRSVNGPMVPVSATIPNTVTFPALETTTANDGTSAPKEYWYWSPFPKSTGTLTAGGSLVPSCIRGSDYRDNVEELFESRVACCTAFPNACRSRSWHPNKDRTSCVWSDDDQENTMGGDDDYLFYSEEECCAKWCAGGESEATAIESKATTTEDDCPVGQCRSPDGICGNRSHQCLVEPCLMMSCEANTVCEANYCGGCHAICSPSVIDDGATTTLALKPEFWWPVKQNGVKTCIYSSDYPDGYSATFEGLVLLFDAKEECCDAHSACQMDTVLPTVSSPVSNPEYWYPHVVDGAGPSCIHGSDYPHFYIKYNDDDLMASFLFKSHQDCCTAYPRACPTMFWYPNPDRTECVFGDGYPMSMMGDEDYLFFSDEECCARWCGAGDDNRLQQLVKLEPQNGGNTPLPVSSAYSTDCIWHKDIEVENKCTNSQEYPEPWGRVDLRDHFLFATAEKCCEGLSPQDQDDCTIEEHECHPGEYNDLQQIDKLEPQDGGNTPLPVLSPPLGDGGAAGAAMTTMATTTAVTTTTTTESAYSTGCKWHKDAKVQNKCTNSKDYPIEWTREDLRAQYLLATAEECCEVTYPQVDCTIEEHECHPDEFLVLEPDSVVTDIPWNFGSPTPQWRMDDTVSFSSENTKYSSSSITNIPATGTSATSDLKLHFFVPDKATISCMVLIDIHMPFESLVVFVNGSPRNEYNEAIDGWVKVLTGFTAGDNTVMFRVQNSEYDAPFHRQEDHGDYGNGRVWMDKCQISSFEKW